eukprot:GEMP01101254.1.p1 GENE.GEMP01101254.1~~GEMP01101254.1.p1  ORF type:complete len:100 (-),score=5.18 GEMP01101254.1:76-375(-)
MSVALFIIYAQFLYLHINTRLGWRGKQERPHPRNALAPCPNGLNVGRILASIKRIKPSKRAQNRANNASKLPICRPKQRIGDQQMKRKSARFSLQCSPF